MEDQIEVINMTTWEDDEGTLYVSFNGHREPLPELTFEEALSNLKLVLAEIEEELACAQSKKRIGFQFLLLPAFIALLLLCLGV